MLTVISAAEETTRELPIEPWLVGLIALAALIVLLMGTLSFGKGREHT